MCTFCALSNLCHRVPMGRALLRAGPFCLSSPGFSGAAVNLLRSAASSPRPRKHGVGGSGNRESLWRTSSIRKVFHIAENSGYGEGVVSFTCAPGGAWGAAGNGGVPVLWGLDRGSDTAVCFQSPVCFRAHPAYSSRSGSPESALVLMTFSAFLV